jgi:CRP-like cAMP-binding protein
VATKCSVPRHSTANASSEVEILTDTIEILADMLEKHPGIRTRQIAQRLGMTTSAALIMLRYWQDLGRVYSIPSSYGLKWFLSTRFVFERAVHEALESPTPPGWVEQYAAGRQVGLSIEDAWEIAKRNLVIKPREIVT